MRKFKSFKCFLLSAVFLFTAICSNLGSAAYADTTTTSDFKQLGSLQVVSDMGAGWNLGNQFECPDKNGVPSEDAWNNPVVTKDLIDKVKAEGFKTIRMPISYLKRIGEAPNYTIDAVWLARIKEVVDYAYSQGMYVIINMHGDGYKNVAGSWLWCDSSDQATIKDKYGKVWKQIADTFKDYNEHLIFESMNEEFNGDYGRPNAACYANINAYNQIFVDTVRQTGSNNSARWLLVPGWNTNIDYTAGDYGFKLPTDNYRSREIPSSEKRIMVSVHYYSPYEFCGDQYSSATQWGQTATSSSKKAAWGQEDYLESQFKAMYDKFVTQGYPVVIGEYGSIDKTKADSTNNTYRAIFAKAVCATARKYGEAPVYWDNGWNGDNGYGLFDRTNCTVTQQGIIDGIMSGINTKVVFNSTINPTSASFDKNVSAQTDIGVDVELNCNTLNGIKNGSELLVPGTDYTVSGNTVTILKSYLLKQDEGITNLTFDFSDGTDPILAVNVTDSTPANQSTIAPSIVSFDQRAQADIGVTMTLNGNALKGIKNGSELLVPGTDYTVSDNTVTILKNYLAKQDLGTTSLTFDFSKGTDPTLTVNIIDSVKQAGSLKLQEYNGNITAASSAVSPKFLLTNTGNTAINLADVKIRYYYTDDSEKAQDFWCDWSSVGYNNVTGKFVKMSAAKEGADHYLEVGFNSTAGSLAPGQSIYVNTRTNREDWSSYTQTDDYSFNGASKTYSDWNKVTAYIAGSLKCGVEP